MNLDTDNPDPFDILSSTKNVLANSDGVTLNFQKIDEISKQVGGRLEKGLEDAYGLGLTGNYEGDCQLVFLQDAVNFCFWAEENQEKWKIEYPKGNIISGGWFGLVVAFKRAREQGIPILEADYLINLNSEKTREVFKSATQAQIPLLESRLNNLIEAGTVLKDKFEGKFNTLLDESNFDALEIINLTLKHFPSFRDEANYKGKPVYFFKRAQILANDLSHIKKESKRLDIQKLDQLTAFADYKIPQMLRQFGAIEFAEKLAEKVDSYKLIPAACNEEIEIRAATIWGVELIKNKLKKYSSSQIDNALWLLSQDQTTVEKPYHRTYTIFY